MTGGCTYRVRLVSDLPLFLNVAVDPAHEQRKLVERIRNFVVHTAVQLFQVVRGNEVGQIAVGPNIDFAILGGECLCFRILSFGLHALVDGSTGRKSADQITVFKNGGGAHLDIMVSAALVAAHQAEAD